MNNEWQEPKDYLNPPIEQTAIRVFILLSVMIIAFTWDAYSFEKAVQVYLAFITFCTTGIMLYKKSIEFDPGFDERDWQQRAPKPKFKKEEEQIELVTYVEGTAEWEEVFGGRRVKATTDTSSSPAYQRRPMTPRKRKEHTTN